MYRITTLRWKLLFPLIRSWLGVLGFPCRKSWLCGFYKIPERSYDTMVTLYLRYGSWPVWGSYNWGCKITSSFRIKMAWQRQTYQIIDGHIKPVFLSKRRLYPVSQLVVPWICHRYVSLQIQALGRVCTGFIVVKKVNFTCPVGAFTGMITGFALIRSFLIMPAIYLPRRLRTNNTLVFIVTTDHAMFNIT